jgi:hypothetical protein
MFKFSCYIVQCCGPERVFVEGHDWGAEVAPFAISGQVEWGQLLT